MLTAFSLGQVGYILRWGGTAIAIDPYLSNSVAEAHGSSFNRMAPCPAEDADLADLDWVLLTHAHLDHTDPASVRRILSSAPGARWIAPYESRDRLGQEGIDVSGFQRPLETEARLADEIVCRAVPSAHTALERNPSGELRHVGYVIHFGKQTVYHAGDTIPHPEIFDALRGASIDIAFLPVNERNYYRDRAGIIGNMTIREAFRMAEDIGIKKLVPTHWDLFAQNSVHVEEIELLHRLERPAFDLEVIRIGELRSFE